ncbi:MAG: GHMP kinase [Pseudomonadota bacterium]
MSTNGFTSVSKYKTARAPGKLILSGEHSVVYGAPALSVAIDRYTDVWFTPVHRSEGLRTAFENLSRGHFYPLDLLKGFKQSLDSRFDAFLRGELPVQKIMQRPDDLAIYTMTSLFQMLPVPGRSSRLGLPVPGQLNSRSDLPLGAGMGSSAAVIAATIVLYEHLLGVTQQAGDRFERVRFCERLQHGKGSFTDAAAVTYGGINNVLGDQVTSVELDDDHPLWTGDQWYWVQHGRPEVSTGECVAAVRSAHGADTQLWQHFERVTLALQTALQTRSDPTEPIRENHRLLSQIGVVPDSTSRFIAAVECAGGAAKISGAGATRGNYGGVKLVYMPDAEQMEDLMRCYPERRWAKLRVSREGAHLRDGIPRIRSNEGHLR